MELAEDEILVYFGGATLSASELAVFASTFELSWRQFLQSNSKQGLAGDGRLSLVSFDEGSTRSGWRAWASDIATIGSFVVSLAAYNKPNPPLPQPIPPVIYCAEQLAASRNCTIIIAGGGHTAVVTPRSDGRSESPVQPQELIPVWANIARGGAWPEALFEQTGDRPIPLVDLRAFRIDSFEEGRRFHLQGRFVRDENGEIASFEVRNAIGT